MTARDARPDQTDPVTQQPQPWQPAGADLPFDVRASPPAVTVSTLLIEDDDAHATLMLESLRAWNGPERFEVTRAEDLATTLGMLAERRFDLILADLSLPDSEPAETLRAILPTSSSACLVVITSIDDPVLASHCIDMGAQDYMVKSRATTDELIPRALHALHRRNIVRSIIEDNAGIRALLRASPTAVLIVAPNGTIRFANPAAADMLGRPVDVVGGMPFGLPLGGRKPVEVVLRRPGLPPLIAEMTTVEMQLDDDGALLVSLHDVTERTRMHHALAAHERRLRTLVNTAPITLWATDQSGHVTACNGREVAALGLGPQTIGDHFTRPFAAFPAILQAYETAQEGHVATLRLAVEDRYFEVHLEPAVDEGLVVGVTGAAMDVTDTVRLQDAQERLERQRERARRAEEMEAFQSRVINRAAHELNTPLTPVKLQLEMLRSGRFGQLGHRHRMALDTITRNLERFQVAVQRLLDVGDESPIRIEPGTPPIDMADIVRRSTTLRTEDGHIAGVEVTCTIEQDVPVYGDEVLLASVLDDLIDNAIQAAAEGGHVRVTLNADQQEARVVIHDDGVGFDEHTASTLFRPYMADADAHGPIPARPGLGLGLFRAQRVAEAHGGTVSATSPGLGKGATFILKLPRADTSVTPDVGPPDDALRPPHPAAVMEDPAMDEQVAPAPPASGDQGAAFAATASPPGPGTGPEKTSD